MSACSKFLAMVLALGFGCSSAVAASHPVPKERAALTNRDWLPHVVSKIAPLEWWSVAASSSDLRREDFSSDYQYEQAKLETSFPRFCFSLFRPRPDKMPSLIAAVNAYKGEVIWAMDDECISAMPGTPGAPSFRASMTPEERESLREKYRELALNPPKADAEFVKRAMTDAAKLAAYIEECLNLSGKPSLDFDPQWLTREGLAASRGQFDDYWEPGSWSVFLARKPQQYAGKFEPTSTQDRPLAFGIAAYEMDALFDELSPGWEAFQREDGPVIPAYPLLSRLSDMTADVLYDRNEVDALLDECLQTQARVKTPDAIRGLDNMVRIARWAQKLKAGIYFGAQNP
jgi:hypothetical protein